MDSAWLHYSELRELIEAAFAGVSRDGDVSWHEALSLDSWKMSAHDLAQARLLDDDEQWSEVPDLIFEKSSAAPAFLGIASMRYYLPKFMLWRLWKGSAHQGQYPVLSMYSDLLRRANELASNMTAEQRLVVCQFLIVARDELGDELVRDDLIAAWRAIAT